MQRITNPQMISLQMEMGGLMTKELELYADATRIYQILTNLVGNAIKFTMKGEVVITVSISSRYDTVKLLSKY